MGGPVGSSGVQSEREGPPDGGQLWGFRAHRDRAHDVLLTGSGPIWTAVAVIAGGTALAFFLGASVIIRVLAVLALVLGVANAISIENQMSTKRDELTRVFDQ